MSNPKFPAISTLLDAREVSIDKFDALYAKITQERGVADGYFLQAHPDEARLLFVINGAPYGSGRVAGSELGFLEIHEFFAAYQQRPASPLSFCVADKRLLLGLMVLFRHHPTQTLTAGRPEVESTLRRLGERAGDAILGLHTGDEWGVAICTKGRLTAAYLPHSAAEFAGAAGPVEQLLTFAAARGASGKLLVVEETRVAPAGDVTLVTPETRPHLSEVFLRLLAKVEAEAEVEAEAIPQLELETAVEEAPPPPPPAPVEELRPRPATPIEPRTLTIKAPPEVLRPEPAKAPPTPEVPKGPIPEVLLLLGDKELGRFSLAAGELTIGRTTGNSIVIENAGVSRRHAVVRAQGDQVVVEDLGSANGTFVKGEKITTHTLQDGDEIQVVKHRLVYRIPKEAEAPSKAAPAPDAGQKTMYIDPAALAQAIGGKPPPPASGRTEAAPQALRPRLILPDLKKYQLEEEEITLGSGPGCQIKLAGMFVGKEHAKIARTKEGQFRLTHLGGMAGTRVNGEKVAEHLLKHGDEIEIGKQKLLFRLER